MEQDEQNWQKVAIVILSLLFIGNFAFLDYKEFTRSEVKAVITPTIIVERSTPTVVDACPQSCLLQINEATASLQFNNITPEATTQPTSVPSSEVKEFFIPLGSGMSSAGDWEDVYGLQVYLDKANYAQVKKILFEASVRIPTLNQTANVRLYNATDKKAVASSEVTFSIGASPILLVSQPITLDSGNKLYQVQMKTQIKQPAYLDQVRIHLFVE